MDAWHGAGKMPEDREARAVCEAVERLVMERRAGQVVGPAGCEPLLWELLILWERRQYGHESLARRVPWESAAPPEGSDDEAQAQPDSDPWAVTITVDGRKCVLPRPPEGWAYDETGLLVYDGPPPSDGRNTTPTLRTLREHRAVYVDGELVGYYMKPFSCEHPPPYDHAEGGQLKCRLCGDVGN